MLGEVRIEIYMMCVRSGLGTVGGHVLNCEENTSLSCSL